jgi:hypothetical protein
MFTSHLDTATSQRADVVHVIENGVCRTDGKSILGADDKAGVTIMLWMIKHGVPGLYYFFIGEEVGCVGSKALANKIKDNRIEGITKVISFDRRGTDSVITFQASSRCCSDTFAKALADQLNKKDGFKYSTDPSGVWTDSAQFTKIYPECTNISVGYRSEHTCAESQDLNHLVRLAEACLEVDWESLPVERDPSVVEYSSWGSYYGGGYRSVGYTSGSYGSRSGDWSSTGWPDSDGWDNYDYGYQPRTEKVHFFDEKFRYISSVTLEKNGSKLRDLEFSDERLEYEKDLISDLLESMEVDYFEFVWDGVALNVTRDDGDIVTCSREEIAEFIKDLDFWKSEMTPKDAWDDNFARDKSLVY